MHEHVEVGRHLHRHGLASRLAGEDLKVLDQGEALQVDAIYWMYACGIQKYLPLERRNAYYCLCESEQPDIRKWKVIRLTESHKMTKSLFLSLQNDKIIKKVRIRDQ